MNPKLDLKERGEAEEFVAWTVACAEIIQQIIVLIHLNLIDTNVNIVNLCRNLWHPMLESIHHDLILSANIVVGIIWLLDVLLNPQGIIQMDPS